MCFKVGDRVKLVRLHRWEKGNEKYEEQLGKKFTIKKIEGDYCWFKESNDICPFLEDLELVKEYKMTKEHLKDGDIVTLRNGDRLVLFGEDFFECSEDNSNWLCDLDDLDDNLNCEKYCGREMESDIIKVERPVRYETVFEREEVKELTVDEISERLGYKVKVVGEDR